MIDMDYMHKIHALVEEHGVAIQGVFGEENFAYTVGLAGQGLPEFIIFGLPHEVAATLLNLVAAHAKEAPIETGIRNDILEGYPAWLLPVNDSSEYLTVAALYADVDSVAAYQIVFPDMEGRWPWDEGSRVVGQRLLCTPPASD